MSFEDVEPVGKMETEENIAIETEESIAFDHRINYDFDVV